MRISNKGWRPPCHPSPRSKDSGITVIAALIAVFLLGGLGAGVSYFVASNQQTRTQQVTGDQAFYSSQAGLEFALRQILVSGSQETTISRDFSGETITIARSGGLVTVNTAEKDARSQHSITDPSPPSNQAVCLQLNTGSAAIGGGGNKNLEGIMLNRDASCGSSLKIVGMQISWIPNNNESANRIEIAGNPFEYNGVGQASGSTFDFGADDYTITDNNNHNLTEIRWTSDMTYHNFTLIFLMDDNNNGVFDAVSDSSKTVAVNFLATNQASCFVWNTTNARLTYTNNKWKDLTGSLARNNCSLAIRLDKMTVSWSPTTPTRNLEQTVINGDTLFNSTAASGVEVDLDHVILAVTTHTVDRFRFDDEMMVRNSTAVWKWADQTTNTQSLNLFSANEQNCLTVNTGGAAIDGKKIIGLTLENTCSADIGITAITVSWIGDASRRLKKIEIVDVDGSHTFNSNNASGVAVDFDNEDLYYTDGIGAKDITRLEFNNNLVSGTTYTLAFTLADGNTKTVSVTLP